MDSDVNWVILRVARFNQDGVYDEIFPGFPLWYLRAYRPNRVPPNW
jgi:hypothetical protein